MDLDPGTVVAGRYRISRLLGRGGMGEVFAAENIRTGRPVAIKLLRQDSKAKTTAVARFRQEARAAGQINSDHVTQVLDVEEDPEHGVVLVFELLEGESLIDRLKRTGPLPFDELYPIIEQVWMGLADAHRAGIIHRDLKPSNVFLERRPDGSTRVKILDFGISKVPKEAGGETLTEMGQSLGTFSFMPPEQIGKAKTVDHRADIYACATLIYQSLTAQLPYNARNILIMVDMKTKTDPRKLSDALAGPFDPRLEAFVQRGLSREPSNRFQTAVDALAAWRELRPGPASGQAERRSRIPDSAPSTHKSSRPRPPSVRPPISSVPPGGQRSPSSPALPRVPSSPALDVALPIPRPPQDAEPTTDDSAATLAMPFPHLGRVVGSHVMPPLAPRVDSAAKSISSKSNSSMPAVRPEMRANANANAHAPPVASTAPLAPIAPVRAEPASRPEASAQDGSVAVHAVVPIAPAAHARAVVTPLPATSTPLPPSHPSPPPVIPREPEPPPHPRAALPNVPAHPDDIASTTSEPATRVYRPRAPDPARQSAPSQPDLQPAPAAPPKRGVPLVLVLFGFLVMGFVVVALVIWVTVR